MNIAEITLFIFLIIAVLCVCCILAYIMRTTDINDY